MRLTSFFLLLAAVSCGSSLGDPNQPTPSTTTTPLPAGTEADCMMFNPTACRLDVAKTSVGIDVHYPNVVYCRLQLLPTVELLGQAALDDLAASWQVTMDGVSNQTVLTPEIHQGALEYPLGTEALYLTRVTFTSKTTDTLATLIGTALRRADVSLFAAPIECPWRRPSP
jgi:hypothetical protein